MRATGPRGDGQPIGSRNVDPVFGVRLGLAVVAYIIPARYWIYIFICISMSSIY